jgi:hypothetical protein
MSPYKISSSNDVLLITIKPEVKYIPQGLHISFPYAQRIKLTEVAYPLMIYHYT